jgi:biotin carboxyl carrier protein
MKRYRVTIDGETYEVEVEDARVRPVVARIGDETFLVDVEADGSAERAPAATPSQAAKPPRAAAPALAQRGNDTLPAPIPGVVTLVAVVAGQSVERGDPILTIEAMKMFNVIRSPRAGTIAAVHVVDKAQVSQGDILVTFVS